MSSTTTRNAVILVTGTSRGIGLAVANILLNDFNVRVTGFSRSPTPIQSDNFLSIQGDVTDEQALSSAVSQTKARFGHLDGLVLNAGTLAPLCRISDDTPLSSWKSHFDANFFSLISLVRAALPDLRSSELRGRIVFVSSGAAVKGTPGWGPYNASKAAMNSLCRTLAEEETDVISVAVRPGIVDTDMQLNIRRDGAGSMTKSGHTAFVDAHTDGKLLPPILPGQVIASLSIAATESLSGEFVNWDDERLSDHRSKSTSV